MFNWAAKYLHHNDNFMGPFVMVQHAQHVLIIINIKNTTKLSSNRHQFVDMSRTPTHALWSAQNVVTRNKIAFWKLPSCITNPSYLTISAHVGLAGLEINGVYPAKWQSCGRLQNRFERNITACKMLIPDDCIDAEKLISFRESDAEFFICHHPWRTKLTKWSWTDWIGFEHFFNLKQKQENK